MCVCTVSYYLAQKNTLTSPVSATVSLESEITKTVTSVRVCPGVGITFTLLLILNSSPEKIMSNLVFFYVVKHYFTLNHNFFKLYLKNNLYIYINLYYLFKI